MNVEFGAWLPGTRYCKMSSTNPTRWASGICCLPALSAVYSGTLAEAGLPMLQATSAQTLQAAALCHHTLCAWRCECAPYQECAPPHTCYKSWNSFLCECRLMRPLWRLCPSPPWLSWATVPAMRAVCAPCWRTPCRQTDTNLVSLLCNLITFSSVRAGC